MCVDLPEVRRLCGVKHCPDCMPSEAEGGDAMKRRTTDSMEEVLDAAMEACVAQGNGRAAKAMLTAADMSHTHLSAICALLRLVHFCVSCLPGDRLHLS